MRSCRDSSLPVSSLGMPSGEAGPHLGMGVALPSRLESREVSTSVAPCCSIARIGSTWSGPHQGVRATIGPMRRKALTLVAALAELSALQGPPRLWCQREGRRWSWQRLLVEAVLAPASTEGSTARPTTAVSVLRELAACSDSGPTLSSATWDCIQTQYENSCPGLTGPYRPRVLILSRLATRLSLPRRTLHAASEGNDAAAILAGPGGAAFQCEIRILDSLDPNDADIALQKRYCAFCADSDAGVSCAEFLSIDAGFGSTLLLSDSVVEQMASRSARRRRLTGRRSEQLFLGVREVS